MTFASLLNDLNDAQRTAATTAERHALVLAGAGCGKTKTIVARAAHLIQSGVPPHRIHILTFTRRAANEIVERVRASLGVKAEGLKASTFHAWCMALIRKAPSTFGCANASILDRDDQLQLFKVLRGKNVPKEFPTAATLCDLYSFARNTNTTLTAAITKKEPSLIQFNHDMAHLMQAYDKRKEARDYLDYDDILELVAHQMKESVDVQHWVASQQDYLLVDEMQDTNPLQWRLLDPLQFDVSLFCVGDDAQSIYAFRGADFKNVHRFTERVPGAVVLKLEKNYRSTQRILDASNWLLSRSELQYNKKLIAARNIKGQLPQLHRFVDEQSEAHWLSEDLVRRHREGAPWRHHMVLVRSSYSARFLETAFLNRDVPYRFIGGTKLMESAHIRDVLSPIRIASNPRDEIGWMRYLTLWEGVGESSASKFIEASLHLSTLDGMLKELKKIPKLDPKAIALLEHLILLPNNVQKSLDETIAALSPTLEDRYANKEWDTRKKDFELLRQLAQSYTTSADFMADYVLDPISISDAEHNEHQDVTTLITVHSAKGTECPVCYVSNVSPASYPSYRAKGDQDAIEEERRVLYVAMTRAQNELILTRQGIDALTQPEGWNRDIPEGKYTTDFLEFAPVSLFEWHTHGLGNSRRPTGTHTKTPPAGKRPSMGIRVN